MKRKPLFWVILLALLLCGALVCMAFADGLQRSGGAVNVTDGVLQTESGSLTYKLYTPLTATEAQKAPGVLLLHGYQNDHETCAAYAIELARRGAVVLALDEYGHGNTQIGLRERGYVDHKLSVNYGAPGSTLKDIGGPIRYRVMMNFSNLSFFDPLYSRDSQGNAITDSSCGGVDAYRLLSELANVDSGRLAVSGHSMGTWSSWSVAAAYAGSDIAPRAVVLQCGELFYPSAYESENIHFNNVLLLQAKYDEFCYFRDYQNNVDDVLLKSNLRTQFLGTDADHAAWDTTFGSFEDGTARRMELLNTNHRLTTHNAKGLSAAMDWLHDAIGLSLDIPAREQVAMAKEWLTFAAMLLTLCAMLPLMELLLPLPESIFRMTIGNGFVAWYALLILVMLLTNGIARRGAKKRGRFLTLHDMGLSSARKPERVDFGMYAASLVISAAMVGLVYGVNALCQWKFDLDLRFIWPFFRPFTQGRLVQFWVYFHIFALFYLLSTGKVFAMQRTNAAYLPGLRGFLGCWWRSFLIMAGGLLLIVLLEYIPFFAGIGPGADILFGSTFGGPFMSLLIVFVPQVLVFSLLGTYCYRRTGTAAVGAFTTAALACWIVTGGSAML